MMMRRKSNGDAKCVLEATGRRMLNVRICGEISLFFGVKWAARSGL